MIQTFTEKRDELELEMETRQAHNESEGRITFSIRKGEVGAMESVTLYSEEEIQFLFDFLGMREKDIFKINE